MLAAISTISSMAPKATDRLKLPPKTKAGSPSAGP
jgi:hypothetical protein